MDLLFARPSSEVTRPQSQSERDTMNITPCIYPVGRFTTMFGVVTEMQ